jgi:hypothetical protein
MNSVVPNTFSSRFWEKTEAGFAISPPSEPGNEYSDDMLNVLVKMGTLSSTR